MRSYIFSIIVFFGLWTPETQECLFNLFRHESDSPITVISHQPTRSPWIDISSFGRYRAPYCKCGVVPTVTTETTLPNSHATEKENPWYALIKVAIEKGKNFRGTAAAWGYYYCGGTVVNDLFILTSASCVFQYDPAMEKIEDNKYKLAAGREVKAHQISVWLPSGNDQHNNFDSRYSVQKVIRHPDFPFEDATGNTPNKTDNDISLLMLSKRIIFQNNPQIRPVCLPFSLGFRQPPGKALYNTADIVGWNSKADCNNSVRMGHLEKYPTYTSMCPVEDTPQQSLSLRHYLCSAPYEEGDPELYRSLEFGSPLVIKSDNNRITQVGILSWILTQHIRYGWHLKERKHFRLFTKLTNPEMMSFIDYHSWIMEALWCSDNDNVATTPTPTIANSTATPT